MSDVDISTTDKRPDSPEPGQLTQAMFHIMLALGQGELHGYGIMQTVERISAGRVIVGPGTLYRSLQKMLRDGLIVEVETTAETPDDDRRRNYRLSDHGRSVAAGEARRLHELVEAARQRGFVPADRVEGTC